MAKKKAAVMNTAPDWKRNLALAPGEYVNSVAISKDGKRVVGGSYFYTSSTTTPTPPQQVGMFAFDAKGNALWGAWTQFPATYGVNWVALSRDGQWAAGVGQLNASAGFISTYGVDSGNVTSVMNPTEKVKCVALDGDGSVLAAGGHNLYVSIRAGNPPVWSDALIMPMPLGVVERVAISQDGSWIAAAVDGGTLALVANNSLGGLSTPFTWSTPGGAYVQWIAFAGNGLGVAAAVGSLPGTGGTGAVYYFDLNGLSGGSGGTVTPAWSVPTTGFPTCRSVAVTDDGSLIAAVAGGGTAGKGNLSLLQNNGSSATQLWAVATNHAPNCVSIDALGTKVAVADGFPAATAGSFAAYDAANGNLIKTYATAMQCESVQISANGNAAACGGDDGFLYYFKL
jgi:hypothetical protein